jgi:hypothetical protein
VARVQLEIFLVHLPRENQALVAVRGVLLLDFIQRHRCPVRNPTQLARQLLHLLLGLRQLLLCLQLVVVMVRQHLLVMVAQVELAQMEI